MVSQADRELIHNFVTELLPYVDTVDHGVQEFAHPTRDGVVVGQAIQALGMIKGAGSILQVEGLVTVADFIARAFELVQTNSVLAPEEAYQRLLGLKAALDDLLTALESGMDATPIVTRARTIFESIPANAGRLPGTASLRDRASLDALFADRAGHTRAHSAPPAGDDAALPATAPQAVTSQSEEHDTRELVVPADMPRTTALPAARTPLYPETPTAAGASPARILPPVAEPVVEVDPELREIFAEEAAELVVSFGENAKAVATAPGSTEALGRLRRDAHTIKGAANMTGFPVIGRVGGAVEHLLDEHLDSGIPVGRDTLELLLVCWKMLRAMLARMDDLAMFQAPSNSTVQRAEHLRQVVAARAAARRVARVDAGGQLTDDYQPTGYDYQLPVAPIDEPAPITEKLSPELAPQTAYFERPPEDALVAVAAAVAAVVASADVRVESDDVLVSEEPDTVIEPYDDHADAQFEARVDDVLVEPEASEAAIVLEQVNLAASAGDDPAADQVLAEHTEQDLEHRPAPGAFAWRYVERFPTDAGVEEDAQPGAQNLEEADVVADSEAGADPAARNAPDVEVVEPDASDTLFLPDVDALLTYEELTDDRLLDELDEELLVEEHAAAVELDTFDPAVSDAAGPPQDEAPAWDELVQVAPGQAETALDAAEDVVIEPGDRVPEFAADGGEASAGGIVQAAPEAGYDVASFQTPDWLERPKGSTSLLNPSVVDDELPAAGLRPAEDALLDVGEPDSTLDAGLLSTALLDLAFAAEVARVDRQADAPADITILDQHRESELALEMFETFAVECAEHLDALNRAAMQLDREPGAIEPLRGIKRALHTLKGASAAADLPALSERCHQLEDSLAGIELSGRAPGRDFAGELFSAVEQIEGLLLARRGELRGVATEDAVGQAELGAAESTTLRVALTKVDGLLNTVGELVVNRAGMEQRLERLSDSLEELVLTAGRLQLTSQLLEREAHGARMFGRAQRGDLRAMNAGAFAVHERMPGWDSLEFDRYTEFDRLIRQLTEVGADINAAVNEMTQLRGDLETVSTRQRRLTTAMQDDLMDIRMVPLASLAPRLYRVVRRVSGDRGKEVRLILEGGDTPFDKTLLDALHEPLLHLLRNAVDHGIEEPAARRRAGKPELGTIRIRSYRDGSEAVIDVIDDGAGIDHEQVLARAQELGLTGEGSLGRADALRLIFRPGFSTRTEADEVSGRGVGLDIVENVVTRFKGRLAVDSSTGRGTIFSLRLPVMLAVTQAFMVTAGGERYAIPIANIESVADREDQRFSQFGDAVVMELGDTAIPVIDLSARLGRPEAPLLERESGWILVAQVGERRWALYVDELEGQQEIVVKPLGRFLRNTPGLLGATILGNGDVALIADVPQLLGVSRRRAELDAELPGGAGAQEVVEAGRRARVALVVDDSLSVRRVVGRTLERHGWVTVLARDGVEALDLLEAGEADVIVTDIEMPRMDGFELLSSVRARPALAETPVIVLTSRSSDKHRGRAFELGADAYLVKPFQEQELIETVQRAARVTPAGAVA